MEAMASGALILVDRMSVPRPNALIEGTHIVYYGESVMSTAPIHSRALNFTSLSLSIGSSLFTYFGSLRVLLLSQNIPLYCSNFINSS